jgi:glycosyltransferase involved in cell wall biosynthesis
MRLLELERPRNSTDANYAKPRTARNGHTRKITGSPDSPRITLKLHGANLDLQEGEFKRTFASLLEETKDSVTLVGRYQQERLPDLMGDIDWVVVPSIWWENSPLVIQEAFTNRRPVICSNVGGMAEKVMNGVNGVHFRVGDPTSLASAIRKAVKSPAMWNRLRRGIPPIYRLDDQVPHLCDLYRQLLVDRHSLDKVNASVT